MEVIIKLLFWANAAFFIMLITYKTIKLPKATSRHFIRRWFYFNRNELFSRQSLTIERRNQNRLSIILFFLFGSLIALVATI